jgi:hypothetical protein
MTDTKSHARVQRFRKTRRERGLVETNVWIPESVRQVIEQLVSEGKYPSRRVAITHALEKEFTAKSDT